MSKKLIVTSVKKFELQRFQSEIEIMTKRRSYMLQQMTEIDQHVKDTIENNILPNEVQTIAWSRWQNCVKQNSTKAGEEEEKKKVTVNHGKSKYMIINRKRTNNEGELTTQLRNNKALKRIDSYKYLGTWIEENGTCNRNIEKKKEKCEMILPKVLQMASRESVGNLATTIRIELYHTIIIPILLYNIEAWGKITKGNMEVMESIQGKILKRLLQLPKTTSYLGMLYETGIWRIKDVILYRKLMLLHNILQSGDNRVMKRIILDQEMYPFPGCWLQKVKEDALEIGIVVKLKEIQKTMKQQYKSVIKRRIETNLIQYINENITTKMRTVTKSMFGRKEYINEGKLDGKQIAEVMKMRLHMQRMRENFREEGKQMCQFCNKEEETTEHVLLKCKKLEFIREDIERVEEITVEDCRTEAVIRMLTVWKRIEKMMI